MLKSIAILIVCVVSVLADQISYDGHRTYEISPVTENDIARLMNWRLLNAVDFWSSPNSLLKSFDVSVEPEAIDEFESFLTAINVPYKIKISDLGELLRTERHQQAMRRSEPRYREQRLFGHFYNITEIDEYLDYLEANYPHIIEIEVIGRSLQGRDIRCVKISGQGRVVDGQRPVIFIDAGIHAREWATHMSSLYLLHNLVENSQQYAEFIEQVDWIVVPVVNPDGYHHAHQVDRLWRKNRREIKASPCIGVDLNRNYGYQWKADHNYCGQAHSGKTAFSEPETMAIRRTLNKYKNAINVYLSFHSAGNWMLYPWGYDKINIDNWKQHDEIGHLFAKAIYDTSKANYTVGNAAILLYPAFGASDDYAASIGIEYSFTVEMSKGYGFVLPPNKILSVANETLAGCLAIAKYLTARLDNNDK